MSELVAKMVLKTKEACTMFFGLFGLGKPGRSRLGKFLDKRGISQEWLVNKSGVSRNTISRLANDTNEYEPSVGTIRKIINALREVDPGVSSKDFFDL